MMTQAEYYRSIYDNQISYAVDEKAIKIAKKMLQKDEPYEKIVEYTELSIEAIKEIQKSLLMLNN